LPRTPAGDVVFTIGTGTRFPIYEFALAYEYIAASGCRGEGATAAPLAHVADRPTAAVVRSATRLNPRNALTCWAQLAPFDVEGPPNKIDLYLREIQAGPALRATWAAMKSRGLPWRERYTKFARIELGGTGVRVALPLAMDVRLDNPRQPIGEHTRRGRRRQCPEAEGKKIRDTHARKNLSCRRSGCPAYASRLTEPVNENDTVGIGI